MVNFQFLAGGRKFESEKQRTNDDDILLWYRIHDCDCVPGSRQMKVGLRGLENGL
jgi:hypothetical protein